MENTTNIIDDFSDMPKLAAERIICGIMLGTLYAVEHKELAVPKAKNDLFDAGVLQSAKKAGLSLDFLALIQCGMDLSEDAVQNQDILDHAKALADQILNQE